MPFGSLDTAAINRGMRGGRQAFLGTSAEDLEARDAERLRIYRENKASDLAIKKELIEAQGTTDLAKQGLVNRGALDTQEASNTGGIAVQGLRNTGDLVQQDLANKGAFAIQGTRNATDLAIKNLDISANRDAADVTNRYATIARRESGAFDLAKSVTTPVGSTTLTDIANAQPGSKLNLQGLVPKITEHISIIPGTPGFGNAIPETPTQVIRATPGREATSTVIPRTEVPAAKAIAEMMALKGDKEAEDIYKARFGRLPY